MKKRIRLVSFMLACLLLLMQPSVLAQDVPSADKYASYLPGDSDDDGLITAGDALTALQASSLKVTLTDSQKQALDMDQDNHIQATDALTILQIATKKLDMPALTDPLNSLAGASIDFGVDLLRNAANEESNTVVSPLSVQTMLAMVANGSKGDTLSQMEQLLAGGRSVDMLNHYLLRLKERAGLYGDDKPMLTIANALWLKEGFTVKPEFLQTLDTFYTAETQSAPFNEQTVEDINRWVSAQTDEMIPNIIDTLDPEELMVFINTVLFQAEWQRPFEDHLTKKEIFTDVNGQEQTVEMMHSEEYAYLQDDDAVGFIKEYEGGYRFVALLPNEDIPLNEYLANLTGERFQQMLKTRKHIKVYAAMPKFEARCRIDGTDILQKMGLTSVFDMNTADLSGMTDAEVFLRYVVSEAVIEVDESGTKAGAATIGGFPGASPYPPEPEPFRIVTLDRPFIYAILDNHNNVPLFIGQVTSID